MRDSGGEKEHKRRVRRLGPKLYTTDYMIQREMGGGGGEKEPKWCRRAIWALGEYFLSFFFLIPTNLLFGFTWGTTRVTTTSTMDNRDRRHVTTTATTLTSIASTSTRQNVSIITTTITSLPYLNTLPLKLSNLLATLPVTTRSTILIPIKSPIQRPRSR